MGNVSRAVILFRDEERGSKVSAAVSDDLATGVWRIRDLTGFTIDKWEPSYDTERWRTSRELHVYVQRVGQGPNETLTNTPPQTVGVLEWRPW